MRVLMLCCACVAAGALGYEAAVRGAVDVVLFGAACVVSGGIVGWIAGVGFGRDVV